VSAALLLLMLLLLMMMMLLVLLLTVVLRRRRRRVVVCVCVRMSVRQCVHRSVRVRVGVSVRMVVRLLRTWGRLLVVDGRLVGRLHRMQHVRRSLHRRRGVEHVPGRHRAGSVRSPLCLSVCVRVCVLARALFPTKSTAYPKPSFPIAHRLSIKPSFPNNCLYMQQRALLTGCATGNGCPPCACVCVSGSVSGG
jgi:hypothetical protein